MAKRSFDCSLSARPGALSQGFDATRLLRAGNVLRGVWNALFIKQDFVKGQASIFAQ